VFETKVLRRYLILTGSTRRLEELHDFYCLPPIIRMVNCRRMRE
jgi:hypothetical protein